MTPSVPPTPPKPSDPTVVHASPDLSSHPVAPAHSTAAGPSFPSSSPSPTPHAPLVPDPGLPIRPSPDLNSTLNSTPEFNLDQLASYPEARAIRAMINTLASPTNFGGGIPDENVDQTISGIYMDPWLSGPGNFPEPHWTSPTGEEYYPLLLRFRNGAGGNNVGLIRSSARRHTPEPEPGFPPNSLNWSYALSDLQREIDNYSTNQGPQ